MDQAILAKMDPLVGLVPLPLVRLTTRRRLFVPFYHVVSPRSLPHIKHLYGYKSPAAFERDLVYLKKHFHLASHEEIVADATGRAPLRSDSAHVTFDDGLAECFSVVRHLLLKHEIPCTFFVCKNLIDNRSLMHRNKVSLCIEKIDTLTEQDARHALAVFNDRFGLRLASPAQLRSWTLALGFADRDRIDEACGLLGVDVDSMLREERPYMTSEEILQLHRDGFTIGGHTCNHVDLSRIESWPEAEREIVESCQAVCDLTGKTRVPFAIPFNGIDLRRNDLARLQTQHECIDLIYDTNNLMKDRGFIVNRVCCDCPLGDRPQNSNLPNVLRWAYMLEPLRAVKRRLKSRPR